MKELVEKINAEIADFKANAEAQVVKGNKAAGARARKAADARGVCRARRTDRRRRLRPPHGSGRRRDGGDPARRLRSVG